MIGNFVSSLLSYLLVVLVFTAVGAAAIALGIGLRKKKDAKLQAAESAPEKAEQ